MKKDLKRIENTLNQLSQKSASLASTNNSANSASTNHPQPAQALPPKSVSFEVHAKSPKVTAESVESSESSPDIQPSADNEPNPPSQPKPPNQPKPLNLPKFKAPNFSSLRHAVNPSLASNLLKDMQTIVEGWQTELNQVLRQIQDLYLEGPIVDGWLESYSGEPVPDVAVLRHADVDRLMEYIEEICAAPVPGSNEVPRTGYRLCGVNADGHVWSCPCPADQVPSLSLAISRYHRLRQLLGRQQDLEMRLSQLAEKLVIMHGDMKD
jgi:uncharacterized protein (DUF4415 family)